MPWVVQSAHSTSQLTWHVLKKNCGRTDSLEGSDETVQKDRDTHGLTAERVRAVDALVLDELLQWLAEQT